MQRPPHSQASVAIAIIVPAMLILPGIDAIAKWLSGSISPGQVAWTRFAIQTLVMAPFALRAHGLLWPTHLGAHALRGFLIAATTLIFFAALRHLPLADAIAIFFVEPLLLTLLSAMILRERIGWRRIGAVIAGLIGAMIVIRPGYAAFGWPALLPLGAALCFSFYLLLTRSLSQREEPTRMQFYAGISGFVVMSVALVFGELSNIDVLDMVLPTLSECMLLLLLGVIATVGHWLVVHAFRRAPAALLAPFQYLEILGATALGLILFGDFPDPLAWVGIAIIVASGLYVFHRERALESAHKAEAKT